MTREQRTNYQVVVEALHENGPALKRFVRDRVRPDDAEDVFQMAAMRAIERAESLSDPSRVLPWLYRLYRNVVIDATREQASRRRIFDDAAEVSERWELPSTDMCKCSISQSKHVNPSYALILDLVDMKGIPLDEAARRLHISVNNATVRLHRARAALKKRMLAHCGVSSLRACIDCRCVYDGCCAV